MEQQLVVELRAALGSTADRIHAHLLAGGEGGLTEDTLQRWLRARKMNVATAAHDLAAHAAWRAAWVPNGGRVQEHEVLADIAQDKAFLQGPDRQGRGLLILQARKHSLTDDTQSKRFISYCIDGMLAACDAARNPSGRIAAVFELQDLSLRNLDAVGLKNIFTLLQSHYVEVLDKLYMVNASALFWGLWRVVSPFIDPVTRSKVVFLGSGAQLGALAEEVGPEVLPPYLGGTGQLVPIQQGWQKLQQQKQQQQQEQQQPTQAAPTHGAAGSGEQPPQLQEQTKQQHLSPQLHGSHEPGYQSADAAVLIQTT